MKVPKYPRKSIKILIFWDIFQGLTPEEVADYTRDRMKLCGVSEEIFEAAALEAAYGCCGGSIRRLNTLLHRALIIGCGEKLRTVGAKTIMDAANEIELV